MEKALGTRLAKLPIGHMEKVPQIVLLLHQRIHT